MKDAKTNQSSIENVRDILSQSHILILGSVVDGQRLARDLHQGGASKIVLLQPEDLNKDETLTAKVIEPAISLETVSWVIADIEKSVRNASIVIDVLSDWQKKLTLSDICMDCEKVLVHSGITGFRFQIYTMIPGRSACLRCALPLAGIDEVPLRPTQEETIDSVKELVAAWQSLETVKYLAKIGIIQGNELFKFDCLSGEFEIIRGLDANPDCPDCGRKIARRERPTYLL